MALHPPDPEQVNFIVRYLAEIVTGATVVLLALLSFLGKKQESANARSILTESPVSHAELLQCQMTVNQVIREEFEKLGKDLRYELNHEINRVHIRIDSIHRKGD